VPKMYLKNKISELNNDFNILISTFNNYLMTVFEVVKSEIRFSKFKMANPT